jgi:hypothetical protein
VISIVQVVAPRSGSGVRATSHCSVTSSPFKRHSRGRTGPDRRLRAPPARFKPDTEFRGHRGEVIPEVIDHPCRAGSWPIRQTCVGTRVRG